MWITRRKKVTTREIHKDIQVELRTHSCVLTGTTSQVEIDHKNGRYDDDNVLNLETQTIDDFQPLHRGANLIKRGHCGDCKKTGDRFDARTLGFEVGWTEGEEKFISCKGCYWYDIEDFHRHFVFKKDEVKKKDESLEKAMEKLDLDKDIK